MPVNTALPPAIVSTAAPDPGFIRIIVKAHSAPVSASASSSLRESAASTKRTSSTIVLAFPSLVQRFIPAKTFFTVSNDVAPSIFFASPMATSSASPANSLIASEIN